MALIACPECEAQVSDRAPTCPQCGAPAAVESKVIVAAPVQAFLVNPKVIVYWGGKAVAKLARGQVAEVPIDRDGTMRFEASVRTAELAVGAGRVTRVQLGWDRISGKLVARQVEQIGGTALL